MLEPLVPNFRPDLSVRFKDIVEKHVHTNVKQMEVT